MAGAALLQMERFGTPRLLSPAKVAPGKQSDVHQRPTFGLNFFTASRESIDADTSGRRHDEAKGASRVRCLTTDSKLRIDDYALIGNCLTAALVGRDGSIDWLPLPRFDSPACFAALLGDRRNGRWLIEPVATATRVERRYRSDSLILETCFDTAEGRVVLVDFMPLRTSGIATELIRLVRCERGSVRMRMEAIFRFDYGSITPWVRREVGGLRAIAGPDALVLRTPLPLEGRDETTVAEFTISAGETIPCSLLWYRSHRAEAQVSDPETALRDTEEFWHAWSARCTATGQWRDAVVRSLITLKALTYAPTGGIVAAPTTSLPERIGGTRNWDYRYCWLRDATFTLYALLISGYDEEAKAWREWLLRAVAGVPSELQIMYGLAGERRLPEYELPWLAGHRASRPVRVGNAAHIQRQLDVYGEVMDAFYTGARHGIESIDDVRHVQAALLDYLEGNWQRPDSGIWEARRPERRYTHSAVMAWVAVDRAIKSAEKFGLKGPVDRWRALCAQIHGEVCGRGFNAARGTFVQSYDGTELDAALLLLPLVGFLPPEDRRVRATIDAIARELVVDGFVMRYKSGREVDGLPAGEGVFLICSFWLADNYALMGRQDDAQALFERLLAVRNDVGLLAEEYDPRARQLLGNFPQAYSHVGLINTAHNLTLLKGPADHRANH
jgi:GH15 family glucan-1,4-alpha-glucosidase